eukprot:CAMPEP_0198144904 /NCGR_PEP_ID=MMETSP1443-20131203/19459_1 /TAXON_ID=186043 /ORGANISM="Entomoneis sp., Strain CCMP2396" /LENGTH=284 /DNA_ID=CAMNT_0043808393 /DNA_START=182 /DNA_END=1036 /DNA_ORIENTATION=+
MANPPPVGSEWKRLTPQFLGIFSILTAVYGSIYYAFQDSETILGFPRPGDEFCADAKSAICSRSDLFAFQIASGLSFLVMGGFGFYYWHVKGIQNTIPATPAGRCFSYIPEAEFVAVVCFTFQVWDFFISLGIPEHRTPIMLMHHILASAVSFAGMHCQYLLWYSFFFFGLSEVSSIFLVFMDLAKFFPPESGSSFGSFVEGYCGPIFAATFLFYRGFMWWRITYLKFKDCFEIMRSGQAEKLRPGKTWVLYVLMAFNIPMGMLQIYWSSLILTEIKKLIMGEE